MITEEQKKEYLRRMQKEAANNDYEAAHSNADDILVEILQEIGGFDEILESYSWVGKWYA